MKGESLDCLEAEMPICSFIRESPQDASDVHEHI
jgi:hypothetical protein